MAAALYQHHCLRLRPSSASPATHLYRQTSRAWGCLCPQRKATSQGWPPAWGGGTPLLCSSQAQICCSLPASTGKAEPVAGWSSNGVPVLLKTKGLLRSRIEVPLAFTPALLYIVLIAPDFTAAVTIWIAVQKWWRGGSCWAAARAGDLTAGESPLQGLLWRATFTHPTLGTAAAFYCWWWCFCFYFFFFFFLLSSM